ncbi:hypothetical protein [Selenihalanaerobacter shriftii]|uniref:Uncharacterized protein n=1 Tax=Selenihalanaerobacter shriftii TaxID=142842 RepID=A0A1T4JM01_9FIRM|nr:hypothetical protein [Selenihalanaerobacter shriftii]SJZ31184.1 hypothetical protein SAMN02745118_00176 [Selenihalanaerobacter shriftii]
MEAAIDNYSEMSDSMELIISILIRYPQINKVDIEPNSKELSFTFLIEKELREDEIEKINHKLKQSLELFSRLANVSSDSFKINFKDYGGLTKIKVTTGILSLTKDKISFVIKFIYNEFKESLLSDVFEVVSSQEPTYHEEVIDDILSSLKQKGTKRALVGFREEDKVLVFDRSTS